MKPIKANFLFNIYPFSLKHVMGMKHLDHNLEEVVLIGRKILKSIFKEKKSLLLLLLTWDFQSFVLESVQHKGRKRLK